MTTLSRFRNFLVVVVPAATSAILFLTACSNIGLQRAEPALPTAAVPAALLSLDRGARPDTISTKDLFVGEFGYSPYTNLVQVYQNGTFKKAGQIKSGIDHPYGVWVDSHGLYVANDFAPSITEYGSVNSKPFTYKAGMTSPVAVSTDILGGVFEADFDGYVNEYPQKENIVEKKCSVDGRASAIAMDTLGDVFVAYDYAGGRIAEFTDFSYCRSKKLAVKIGTPGGMAIDKNNHIVICDEYNHAVDIIKPPYKTVSGHLASGWVYPTDVKINAANDRAWVADDGSAVEVYYPGGKAVGSIPFIYAYSIVDGSNYVP